MNRLKFVQLELIIDIHGFARFFSIADLFWSFAKI